MFKAIVLAVLLVITPFFPAYAKDAREIGSYGPWTAYTYQEDGQKVCYMAASPESAKGNYKRRGNVYAMVTHRPADKAVGVFSYLAGYTYGSQSKVTVIIDGQPTLLLGQGETAWTANEEADRKLVTALRKGSKMIVEGVSDKGTETKDTYSLKGSGSAYDAISKECKIS
jgi:hypothetical protein